MPMVQITMLEGRSVEQKHALIREVSEAVARTVAVPLDRVRVALYEVSADDWGIGGVPVSVSRSGNPLGTSAAP